MKKTLIAASVGALMLAAAGTASANSLLFPFFTTAGGASSSVSISGGPAIAAAETLHYVYNYADSKNTCTHYDGNGSITPNDLMQHSIAAPAFGGFGLAAPTDKSKPFYLPVGNTQGFLKISNKSTAGTAAISGDMLLVDPSTNLVFSYPGISNALDTVPAAAEGNFSAAAFQDSKFNLSFYPQGAVATSWYGLVVGNMSGAIAAAAPWNAQAVVSSGGTVYDNDENAYSGKNDVTINCLGNFKAADLMTGAQYAAVGNNGGLVHGTATFPAVVPAANTGTGLFLYKIQIATAAVAAPLTSKVFIHRDSGAAF